jgi:membrane protein implicated in regulation of membrane protease activity
MPTAHSPERIGTVNGDEDEGLGARFWLAIIGGAIGCAIAAIIVLVFLGRAWERWGFFGMFLLLSAILLGFGWIVDRREKKRREGLD